MSMAQSVAGRPRGLRDMILRLNWAIITVLCAIACIGVVMHFSDAEGVRQHLPESHAVRFSIVLVVMIGLALVDTRLFLAIAYPFYTISVLMLVAVEAVGATRMGAQRWIDLGPVSIQPSEFMKIALVLALARYYQQLDPKHAGSFWSLIPPVLMIGAPVALVMHQPDLGTSLLLAGSGVGVMFLAGLRWRFIVPALIAAIIGAVAAYDFALQDYQRDRIRIFLDPAADRLGAGYHVQQSKIAIGSAGLFGQGYQNGTQAQLDFLPEKHTDFIFTMIAEQFGLFGAAFVLVLYAMLLGFTMRVALRARSLFGRLAASGVAVTLALYVLINTSMVIGLIPVVGIPLPLLSFGGTAMLTVMMGMAIVLSIHLHRDGAASSRGFLW